MAQYDVLIVGSGLSGATFAHLAQADGRRCLVVEKRKHIAGNAYTEIMEGIHVHRYGPHIFHTNNDAVWRFVSQFAAFNRYTNSPIASYQGKIYNLPFNMNTFQQLWGVVTPLEAKEKLEEQRRPYYMETPRNLEEQALCLVGKDIYEIFIKGYTEKQWGRPCTALAPSIIRRLPVRFTYDNNYFNAKYQGVPEDGYTAMVQRMLEGVDVMLDTDYLANRNALRRMADTVFFTGSIDAYFGYSLGALAYRHVFFEHQTFSTENFQGNAVVNYTSKDVPYTRVIEHKHFAFGTQPKTVVSYEHSAEWKPGMARYYPIENEENQQTYVRYQALMAREAGVFIGGRLGLYRYLDMDQVIEQTMQQYKTLFPKSILL